MNGSDITSQEFGDFYIRNREKFISIAQSYVRDRQAAEDIVGVVAITAIQAAGEDK